MRQCSGGVLTLLLWWSNSLRLKTRCADGETDAHAAATREDSLEDERERESDSEDVDLSLRPVRLKR